MVQQSLSWAYVQRKTWFKKIHAPYVHSSTINNRQDNEQTLMSINIRMDKEDVIYIQMQYYSAI